MAAFTGLACAAQTCGLTKIDFYYAYQQLDINDGGVVVNTATGDDIGDDFAFLWHRGVATRLPGLGGFHTAALAINNNGKVAGYAEDLNGTFHPVTWTDGVLTKL